MDRIKRHTGNDPRDQLSVGDAVAMAKLAEQLRELEDRRN